MGKETYNLGLLIVMVFILLLIASVGLASLEYYQTKETCDRYSDYGYITLMEGDITFGYDCNIIMEDGTKIDIYDFNIADYKKPLRKQIKR